MVIIGSTMTVNQIILGIDTAFKDVDTVHILNLSNVSAAEKAGQMIPSQNKQRMLSYSAIITAVNIKSDLGYSEIFTLVSIQYKLN